MTTHAVHEDVTAAASLVEEITPEDAIKRYAAVKDLPSIKGALGKDPVSALAPRKHTLTLTFEDAKDLALLARIQKDAIEEDRSAPLNLLRFLRKNYPQG